MGQPVLKYRLSDEPRDFGLSCTGQGLTLAGVPLLTRTKAGFLPRPAWEIDRLLSRSYRTDIDSDRLAAGLGAVARALNDGEMARGMIAAVLLKLPELDWDGAARIARADEALAKAGFDPDESRDSRGRWATGGAPIGFSPANDHLRAPGRADARSHNGLLSLLPRSDLTDDAYLLDIARNSDFHDEIRDAMADQLRRDGLIAVTEVSFTLDGSGIVARADIVAMKPGDPTTLAVIEVKTGPRSRLSEAQEWVYPGLVHGEIVSAPDPKIVLFGYQPGQPLPPVPVMIWYERDPGTPRDVSKVEPEFPFLWEPPR
jgi:hypothetical protein